MGNENKPGTDRGPGGLCLPGFRPKGGVSIKKNNQQIEKLSNLVMKLGTPAAEQTAQTVALMKAPVSQADETMLQNECLTAIRQIKAKVGEDRAAQTALFTDETMEQIA